MSGASTDIESGTSTPTHIKDANQHPSFDIYDPNRPKLGLRQRMKHFTWAWYTLPMSTGGLSLLFFAQPNQFPGLKTIGLVIYHQPHNIYLRDNGDGITVLPSPGNICQVHDTSTRRYAIPKDNSNLVWAVQATFWGYLVVTLILSIGQYSYVFAAHSFSLTTMMPTWILPIFPIMLSGTIASVIAETQPHVAAVPIIVAGLTCQGLGLSVAVMMYAHMIGRLMQAGLPNREHRPGLFMCVGPPAFTALALIGMAEGLPEDIDFIQDGTFINVGMVRLMATMSAIFLWALSLWWFGIAAVAVIQSPPKYFHLGWWAMVFPNTGFTLATISIARSLGSKAIGWFATGMSIVILSAFAFIFYSHVRAVISQDIMYPGRDEDVEDH
ncbi:hypothetical protein HZS61_005832 [Fusarium oxysporum f. sp. conglutinans]|uniref:Malic acid transport protein n=1 Tax=Fusarium oxysporum f. sp. conglutinans TaxID=100902 RepID=A0A8H6LD16_FUSOX|nr:hypothetical protein HZS61_005832 [Fusarium oxysporum f. sp. conglutinans]